jgi:ATP-dependent protease Clp ATPase subunit
VGVSDDEKIERITKLLAALNAGELDDAVELSHSDIVLVRPGGAGEL